GWTRNSGGRSPEVRSATTGSNWRTGPPAAIKLAMCAGVGAVTNASSGISTPHVREIAITTRIAPIDVPPASKKLVSAAKLALPANSAMTSATACSYALHGITPADDVTMVDK